MYVVVAAVIPTIAMERCKKCPKTNKGLGEKVKQNGIRKVGIEWAQTNDRWWVG